MPNVSQDKNRSQTKGSGGSAANITQYLKGIQYPANKQSIVKLAKQNGADQSVIDSVSKLPDKEFPNMAELMKEYSRSH